MLHHVKYGESSLIVTLYSEKHGRLACMVNGVRSKKPRFPATLFQPITLLDVELYYRKNRELQRIKEASLCCQYNTIPFSHTKTTIALFLSEVLYLTLREEESNPVLFSYLFHAFQLLDSKEKGIANFHVWFMIHFSRFLGILPSDPAAITGHADEADMKRFMGLPEEAVTALTGMMESPQGLPDHIKISNVNRTLLLERIIRHYADHVDGFSRLKSFAVLREVFEQTAGN